MGFHSVRPCHWWVPFKSVLSLVDSIQIGPVIGGFTSNLSCHWFAPFWPALSLVDTLPISLVTSGVMEILASLFVQGGSDKSGILQIFIKIYTAQLKIIRFYRNKNTLAGKHIENRIIQWNSRQQRRKPQNWTWTSCRPSPRCPCRGTPSPPYLWNQVRSFVVRLCIDPKLRDATHKIVQRFTVRRAGRPDLLYPHVQETLLELIPHRLTCLWHELTCFHTLRIA